VARSGDRPQQDMHCLNHGLHGLKDFTEKRLVVWLCWTRMRRISGLVGVGRVQGKREKREEGGRTRIL